MDRFVGGKNRVWKVIQHLDKRGGQKLGAIAYLTDADILAFRSGDKVAIDASINAIKFGQTSKRAVLALWKTVELYSFENLHAKVMVIGDTLVTGSMNASDHSQKTLTEAAMITTHPATVEVAKEWLDQLYRHRQARRIDEKEAARIERIEVVQRPRPYRKLSRTRSPRSLSSHDAAWYFFLVSPITLKKNEDDTIEERRKRFQKEVGRDRDVAWIRFTGNNPSASKLKRGDFIYLGDRPSRKSRQITVTPDCRVVGVWRRRGKGKPPRTIAFYWCSRKAESAAVSWREFRDKAKSHGIVLKDRTNTKAIRDVAAAESLMKSWNKKV